jgi:hypothetical protein
VRDWHGGRGRRGLLTFGGRGVSDRRGMSTGRRGAMRALKARGQRRDPRALARWKPRCTAWKPPGSVPNRRLRRYIAVGPEVWGRQRNRAYAEPRCQAPPGGAPHWPGPGGLASDHAFLRRREEVARRHRAARISPSIFGPCRRTVTLEPGRSVQSTGSSAIRPGATGHRRPIANVSPTSRRHSVSPTRAPSTPAALGVSSPALSDAPGNPGRPR